MAVGWALVGWASLKPVPLTRNAHAATWVRKGAKNAYFAIAFYSTCAIVAIWFPLVIAVIITVMWLYWVVYALRSANDSRSDGPGMP